MRGSLHQFGLGGGLFGDRTHGVDEKIAFFLGLGFGGLDHHGAGNNQGKRGGVGVKAVVDEPLGDIHGVHAILFLAIIAEDDFVHGRRSVGKVEYAFQVLADVIRVQHGVFGGLTKAGTVGEDVGEGAHQHSEISAKGAHAAD